MESFFQRATRRLPRISQLYSSRAEMGGGGGGDLSPLAARIIRRTEGIVVVVVAAGRTF